VVSSKLDPNLETADIKKKQITIGGESGTKSFQVVTKKKEEKEKEKSKCKELSVQRNESNLFNG